MGKQNKIYLILFALVVFTVPFFLRNNYHLMVLNISALNILVVRPERVNWKICSQRLMILLSDSRNSPILKPGGWPP